MLKIAEPPKQAYKNGNGYHKNGNGHKPSPMVKELQPHNIEAEEALLGSILISSDSLIGIGDIDLSAEDFFIERHGWIFQAMADLAARCDLITLSDEMSRRGQLEQIGGYPYLTGLLNATPTHMNAGYYARVVKRDSVLRKLIGASGDIARLAHSTADGDPETVLQQANDILLKVSALSQGQARPIGHYCHQFYDQLEQFYSSNEKIFGLPTGLADLDRLLSGLQGGKLILLAGRPGMGKSSLGMQCATQAARQRGAGSLYFSLEMLGAELVERMVCAETGIDSTMMREKRGDLTTIRRATEQVSQWPITIDDAARTVEAIRARAISHQFKHGLDLIIVDYIQQIQTGKSYQNRDAEVGSISKAFKALANDLNVPVVAISSLSRKCEERGDKRPILSDLRESGNLEYDADVVIFIYCDDVYNKDTRYPNLAELHVAKHRGGRTGTVTAYFKRHLTTFVSVVNDGHNTR